MKNPLHSIWHEARYAFDRAFKTGNRRHEFEHKYARHGDYFGYQTKPYELEKYQRTLAAIREWRRGTASALEIGCSVGVFTQMIAPEFGAVTAVDIATKALALAEKQVAGAGDVSYVQSDLLSIDLGRQFDVILCAEVLYYLREEETRAACAILDRHLAPNGLVIEVTQQDREAGNAKFFHGWDRVLGSHFLEVHKLKFDDPGRPYEIVAYSRR
jgi:2-polyprenyl-3-methyl-5-hydroxy-6-metoxy-1,4-benzoquinol methylase